MRSPLLLMILASVGCAVEKETTMCTGDLDGPETCLAPEDVDLDRLSNSECDLEATEVLGEGTYHEQSGQLGEPACCYPVVAVDPDPNSTCMVGRPYLEGGGATVAAARGEAEMDEAAFSEAAAGWLRTAAMEHASVAAFARLTLDLMALGAPLTLLADVQRATADEVKHAELAYALAGRFSGAVVSPGPFPFQQPITPRMDLAAVAADAAREGCVGETMGAWMALWMVEQATDPEVKAALVRISGDETRHAALSWEIVAWALRTGGPEVREAVLAAFREAPVISAQARFTDRFAGLLGPEDTERLCREAVDEVIQPALRAMIAAA